MESISSEKSQACTCTCTAVLNAIQYNTCTGYVMSLCVLTAAIDLVELQKSIDLAVAASGQLSFQEFVLLMKQDLSSMRIRALNSNSMD